MAAGDYAMSEPISKDEQILLDYPGNLQVVQFVRTKESVHLFPEPFEDIVSGMEFDNAKGNFNNSTGKELEEAARASGQCFFAAFVRK